MSTSVTPPRRLVLELAQGPIDARVMRVAAEFARDFGLDVFGVYTEDEALLQLAGFPFAREISLLTHDWRPLDAGSVAEELRGHAETVRRHLREMLDRMGISGGFEVRRGDPVHCVAGVCSPADVIVVTASATVRRARLEQAWVAAERSPAAVLVLPERVVRHKGPIVAVARDQDDPCVAVAAQLADRQHARLVVLTEAPIEALVDDHAEVHRLTDGGTDAVLRALAPIRGERLVVIGHQAAAGIGIGGASRIAAAGAVPVLVL